VSFVWFSAPAGRSSFDSGGIDSSGRPLPAVAPFSDLFFPFQPMTRIFFITGDTSSSREELKAMGGPWVPHVRPWFVPEDQHDALERLRALTGFSITLVSLRGRRSVSGGGFSRPPEFTAFSIMTWQFETPATQITLSKEVTQFASENEPLLTYRPR
jgi:hypothetical protein